MASLLTKLYRRAVLSTRTNYVLRRKTKHNALLRKKDAINEVTYDVPNYFNTFNVFECRRNILYTLDLEYERAFMANPKEEYFTEILDNLNKHNRCHGKLLSSKNLREAVIRVM